MIEKSSPPRRRTKGGPDTQILHTNHNKKTALRVAPYGRFVLASLRAGRHPNVFVYAGTDCWNQAEHRRINHGPDSALVLPPDAEPEVFTWPALDALVAVPGDCDGDRFRRLVIELLAAGTRCIVEVRPDRPPVAHYARDEHARGAA